MNWSCADCHNPFELGEIMIGTTIRGREVLLCELCAKERFGDLNLTEELAEPAKTHWRPRHGG